MKRFTHSQATPKSDTQTSRVNPYPRTLMISGAVLIGYGIIAPTGILLRNVVQSLRATPATISTSATTEGNDKVTKTAVREMALGIRAGAGAARKAATTSPAEAKKQYELMKLYAEWKDAWRKRDVDAIMRLYSPRAQFRMSPASSLVPYTNIRSLLGALVKSGYTVIDKEPPNLSIEGEHAVIIAVQTYTTRPNSGFGLNYNHRFVVEREDVQSNSLVQSNSSVPRKALKSQKTPTQQKTPVSKNTRQWRIVKSEFQNFGGLDKGGRIY
jgi:ketosteroid isomerase-like protein